MLVLNHAAVERIIRSFTLSDLLHIARLSLCSKNDGPQRAVLTTPNYTTLVMPAHLSTDSDDGGRTAVKVVSVPSPTSPASKLGLPATTLVLDSLTGAVKALIDASDLTPVRNAAGSLLSMHILGHTSPTSIVFFGAGKQISTHVMLFAQAYNHSIRECTIVNRTVQGNPRVEDLRRALPQNDSVKFQFLASGDEEPLRQAVRSADVIVTATSSEVPLIREEDVKPGAHIILIGSYEPTMHEVPSSLLFKSRVNSSISSPSILVDNREAVLKEAGEVIDALASGTSPLELIEVRELIDMSGELKPTLERDGKAITVFKSVGVASQDVVIADEVVKRASQMGIGQELDY